MSTRDQTRIDSSRQARDSDLVAQRQLTMNSQAIGSKPTSIRATSRQNSIFREQPRRDSGCYPTKSGDAQSFSRVSRSSSKQSLPSCVDGVFGSDPPNRVRGKCLSRANTGMSIEEAVELHQRSRKLFPSPEHSCPYSTGSMTSSIPASKRTITTPQILWRPRTPSEESTQDSRTQESASSSLDIEFRTEEERNKLMTERDPSPETAYFPTVTMHWTSAETREKEYTKIDKQRKGFRGLWNKLMPKFARTNGHKCKFYNEKDSDVGSVRRYRLALPVS